MPLRLLDGKSPVFHARASFSIEVSSKIRKARAVSWRAMRRYSKRLSEACWSWGLCFSSCQRGANYVGCWRSSRRVGARWRKANSVPRTWESHAGSQEI